MINTIKRPGNYAPNKYTSHKYTPIYTCNNSTHKYNPPNRNASTIQSVDLVDTVNTIATTMSVTSQCVCIFTTIYCSLNYMMYRRAQEEGRRRRRRRRDDDEEKEEK